MPIYDKPVRLLMKDMVTDLHLEREQVLTKQQVLAWFQKHYPKVKEATVSAHLTRLSTNATSRVHYSARPDDDLFFQIDGSRFRLFNPATDPPPIYREGNSSLSEPVTEHDEPQPSLTSNEFAYERDLQNFLAKNLSLIEPGLRLYEEEDVNGLEFPVGGRFIDILALDSKDSYVVIELKVSKGYDRVVGQLLRYMAWISKNHAEPTQEVRGIIIARKISEDLLLACSTVPHVELFEYQLAVSLHKVEN